MTLFFACKKSLQTTDDLKQAQQETQSKRPSPPPPPPSVNANPAIAYRRWHTTSDGSYVPALYVMDANGGNQAVVYTNYTKVKKNVTYHTPDFPSWSDNGQRLCFVLDGKDLYTLNISLVNGVPAGSNPVKIADGVAAGGSYGKGVWRPGTTNIAAVWLSDLGPTSIQLIPSTGGTTTTLYSSPGDFTLHHPAGYLTEAFVTFNDNGTLLAFCERQLSTGKNFLRILDLSINTIVQSIELNQFWAIKSLDWANTQGSSIIGFSNEEESCETDIVHKIYKIDISAEDPQPVIIKNDAEDLTWSPDDKQVAYSGFSHAILNPATGCGGRYYEGNVWIYDLSTNSFVNIGLPQGYNPDWKK